MSEPESDSTGATTRTQHALMPGVRNAKRRLPRLTVVQVKSGFKKPNSKFSAPCAGTRQKPCAAVFQTEGLSFRV